MDKDPLFVAEKAHTRIDDVEKDVHLLKNQVGDMRADLKSLEKGQAEMSHTLVELRTDIRYIRENLKPSSAQNGKSNLAIALSSLTAVLLIISELVKRLP